MARTPKPWFRTERAVWCVHFRGTMHQLGSHPDGFPAPKQVKGRWNAPPPIMRAFHTLLAAPPDKVPTPPPKPVSALTVPDVFESFLEWCQKHTAPRTFDWYRDYLQGFCEHCGRMLVPDLKPFHVTRWLDLHPEWKSSRRGAVIAVKRAFNWATDEGLIEASPVKKLAKPAATTRVPPASPDL